MADADADQLEFDRDYDEVVELRDGTSVRLRLIDASDDDLLRRGFERLSDESKYRRFLGPRSELSEKDLEYLTNLDQYDHTAIGAELVDVEPPEGGIGVARCVRLERHPKTAETAITVVDEYQHLGLGKILLDRLVRAARERDIEYFRASLFARNVPMRKLLEQIGPVDVVERSGPVVTLDVALDAEPTPTDEEEPPLPAGDLHDEIPESEAEAMPESTLEHLLSLTGRGVLSLVHKFRPADDSDEDDGQPEAAEPSDADSDRGGEDEDRDEQTGDE